MSRSPKMARPIHPGHRGSIDQNAHAIDVQMAHPNMSQHQPLTPTYDTTFTAHPEAMGHPIPGAVPPQPFGQYAALDQIWRGFESTAEQQLPVWLSDQTLGGQSFSQNGIDAFLLPNDYLPPGPQIW